MYAYETILPTFFPVTIIQFDLNRINGHILLQYRKYEYFLYSHMFHQFFFIAVQIFLKVFVLTDDGNAFIAALPTIALSVFITV